MTNWRDSRRFSWPMRLLRLYGRVNAGVIRSFMPFGLPIVFIHRSTGGLFVTSSLGPEPTADMLAFLADCLSYEAVTAPDADAAAAPAVSSEFPVPWRPGEDPLDEPIR